MRRYKLEVEIFEGKGGRLVKEGGRIVDPPDLSASGTCHWMYRGDGERSYEVGRRFRYPEESSLICPWLLSSMDTMAQALRYGATLPWTYEGTRYEKVIDPDGVTTEFVRCPDPASSIVVKLIRTPVED